MEAKNLSYNQHISLIFFTHLLNIEENIKFHHFHLNQLTMIAILDIFVDIFYKFIYQYFY